MADIVAPIGTRVLAEKLGVHRNTAWRKLRKIREQRGDRAVTQDGQGSGHPYRTSIEAIREADPHLVELREIERTELEAEVARRFRARNAALEKANANLREDINLLQSQVQLLRKAVSSLCAALQNVAKGPGVDSKV